MNLLELKDIYYTSDNTEILKGISFEVKKGDCISIVGASGSGKSTMLKLCADLITASSGEIIFDGRDYLIYNPLELRKRISYCIQIPYLFGDTVRDNLEFPFKIRKEPLDKEKIITLLNRFGLEDDIINKNIDSLSGGEKQRICIIRNLVYTPEILLLDEATSALDKDTAKRVEEYIKELNALGVTVLWITHSIEQSRGIFNKTIVVSDGKIEKIETLSSNSKLEETLEVI